MNSRVDEATMLQWLRTLWTIRIFEETVERLSRAGEVPGFVHLSTGQEAVAVGTCFALADADIVFSGHRAHGHMLARGVDPYRLLAEILGRASGVCGGFGGSMHAVDTSIQFLGATGVVGGNISIAAGAAWGVNELGGDSVVVVFFGDGAGGTGVFHETLNLASLWNLPLLFVCENNGVAEFTSRSEHSRVAQLSAFTEPYEIESMVVDGNNVSAVFDAALSLVTEMRVDRRPRFLECMTHRQAGHYVGDQSSNRSPDELSTMASTDPILQLRASMLSQDANAMALDRIEHEVRETVESLVEQVRTAEWPEKRLATQHVYAQRASYDRNVY